MRQVHCIKKAAGITIAAFAMFGSVLSASAATAAWNQTICPVTGAYESGISYCQHGSCAAHCNQCNTNLCGHGYNAADCGYCNGTYCGHGNLAGYCTLNGCGNNNYGNYSGGGHHNGGRHGGRHH